MVAVRIEKKPAFTVVGRKRWIGGQDNEQFGVFWSEAKENGLISALHAQSGGKPGTVTGAYVFGVSRVEKDPACQEFFFYIAAETESRTVDSALETFTIPACTWAIFSGHGELPDCLIEAEMYAWTKWLPESRCMHDFAPELEVYPAADEQAAEYWLPILPRNAETQGG